MEEDDPENLPDEIRQRVHELHEVSQRVADRRASEYNDFQPRERRPQYEEFTLPGGENYREMLLRLPSDRAKVEERVDHAQEAVALQARKELMGNGRDYSLDVARGDLSEHQLRNMSTEMRPLAAELRAAYDARKALGGKDQVFKTGHWNEPNILAHVRTKDRVDTEGKKTLFLEELQSDWHQQGRDRGYQTAETGLTPTERNRLIVERDGLNIERERLSGERDPVTNAMVEEARWHELSRRVEEIG